MFEIVDRAAAGRLGRFKTAHGTVTTPTLLPVVNPNLNTVTIPEMQKLGAEMIITNSYVIHKHDNLREKALADGIHSLLDFDGPIMTDSGTFQMYVYGDVEVGPEEIIRFQSDMGVDVATCLDLFVTPDMTREEAEHAVATTKERTVMSAKSLAKWQAAEPDWRGQNTIINSTVQGGLHPDLRDDCARSYRDLDVGYHTIGGVVPIMERQMYPELVQAILASQVNLRKDRPVHLFGAGHPLVFPLATALGCDFFDSSSYAKYAKDGRIMVPEGTLHIEDLVEWPFASQFLDGYSPAELRKAPKQERERLLALHNLDVCFTDIRRIRQAIREGQLWELVEQRAACHPLLAQATKSLGSPDYQAWLEAREPVSGNRALRYTGPLTHQRPVFARIRNRLATRTTFIGDKIEAEFETPYANVGEEKREVAMHKEIGKPFGTALGKQFDEEQDHIVISSLGPVPIGLDEAYPFAQSHLPPLEGLDRSHMGWVGETKDAFLAHNDAMPAIPGPPQKGLDRSFLQVLRTADYQFGLGAGRALTGADPFAIRAALDGYDAACQSDVESADEQGPAAAAHLQLLDALADLGQGELVGERSRKTHKLRTAHLNGEHVVSLRAQDGYFTLKIPGAKLLHQALPGPRMRVVVHADSVAFNRAGKSVFAQFVLAMDPGLRPGDECLVVDEADRLVALGRVHMAPGEVHDFPSGMAVKVRDGIPSESS